MPSAEPLQDASLSRANSQRKRRAKHSTAQGSADADAPDASPHRVPRPRSSGVSRAARSMLGSGSSALESQLSGDARPYLPSLSRISEGRQSDAWDTASVASSVGRQKPRIVRRVPGRQPVESQRRLQERVRAALTSPSMQSVISSLTATTSSSSGSNSTVTQSSYDRDAVPRRDSRRPDASTRDGAERRRRRRERRGDNDNDDDRQPSPAEKVNVFNYLEPDKNSAPAEDLEWLSSASSSGHDESDNEHDSPGMARRIYTPASSVTHSSRDSPVLQHKPSRLRQGSGQDQPHSESGFSARGGSPDSFGKPRQPSVEADAEDENSSEERADAADHSSDECPSWSRRSSASGSSSGEHRPAQPPPPYPNDSLVPYAARPSAQHQLATVQAPPPAPEPPEPPAARRRRKPARASGYDLLATRLSARDEDAREQLAPLYRRFERLNHRILLHLQDEIAEMEEQLAHLDECVARAMQAIGDPPPSRRADARYGGELHFQRTELLGRIFLKVTQYNDALTAFSGSARAGGAPDAEDLERYRALVARLRPVADEELRFLDCADLIRVRSAAAAAAAAEEKPARGGGGRVEEQSRNALLLAAAPVGAILLAFLLFWAAANAAARVFLVVAFSGAGVAAVYCGQLGQELMGQQERMTCLGLYFGLLVVMACTIA